DRGGVEIADFLVAVGPDGVGHGAGVFGELRQPQGVHVVDALDGPGAGGLGGRQALGQHVGGEFLVAEDRQSFFQGQLEPVAAGDAVAGPVVEVFVADHGFDAAVGGVRGCVGVGQDVGGIEDVQALVFHRPHVEVAR